MDNKKIIDNFKQELKLKIAKLNELDKERNDILNELKKVGDDEIKDFEPFMKRNLENYEKLYGEIKQINQEIKTLLEKNRK